MLYQTVEQIYKSLLREVKKSNIASIPPSIFNLLINDAYSLWYRNKSNQIDVDQKRQDDIKELIVITNNIYNFYYSGGSNVLPFLEPVSTNVFPLPKSNTNESTVIINGKVYPSYRRLLNVFFRYEYNGDPCYPDGLLSPWISGKPMKTNQESVILRSSFRKPDRKNIYYKLRGDKVELILGDDTTNFGRYMKLEYVKYPRDIHYDANIPDNNVMCELQSDQIHEIVKIAARLYLAESSDPRYNIELNEMTINKNGK